MLDLKDKLSVDIIPATFRRPIPILNSSITENERHFIQRIACALHACFRLPSTTNLGERTSIMFGFCGYSLTNNSCTHLGPGHVPFRCSHIGCSIRFLRLACKSCGTNEMSNTLTNAFYGIIVVYRTWWRTVRTTSFRCAGLGSDSIIAIIISHSYPNSLRLAQ